MVSIQGMVIALIPVMLLLAAALVMIGIEVVSWFRNRPATPEVGRTEKPAYATERVAV